MQERVTDRDEYLSNVRRVFELGPCSNWKGRVVQSFIGASDGSSPQAALIFDSVGNLYGAPGFSASAGAAVVFEVTP